VSEGRRQKTPSVPHWAYMAFFFSHKKPQTPDFH
jgi:hypothetical protein